MKFKRYVISSSAGSRNGKPWAVLDTHDKQGGKGMKRESFWKTPEEARAEARRLNRDRP